jgi:two-component system cell cycle response regulator CtrA
MRTVRIVLIEDRPAALDVMRTRLAECGVGVDGLTSGPALAERAVGFGADGILISLPLAAGRGEDLVAEIRRRGWKGPVLVLQETASTDEAVALYGAGADDVTVKPVKAVHVAARLRAVVRRIHGFARAEVSVGGLLFPLDGRPVLLDGVPVALSRRERALLECLALRAGKAVGRETIFASIYGACAGEIDPKIIDVYVCKLRKKLRSARGDYISTVFGVGYMLADPETAKAVRAA